MLQFRQLRRKSDLTIAQLRDRLVKQVSPQIRPHAPSLGIDLNDTMVMVSKKLIKY